MPYVRVSYMTPREGQEGRVAEFLRRLSTYYLSRPGYLQGYLLQPQPGAAPRRIGRVGIWDSERAAEEAAQGERALALRSELIPLVNEDSHVELQFVGEADRG